MVSTLWVLVSVHHYSTSYSNQSNFTLRPGMKRFRRISLSFTWMSVLSCSKQPKAMQAVQSLGTDTMPLICHTGCWLLVLCFLLQLISSLRSSLAQQILSMGMMTEYYHYFFTTLVRHFDKFVSITAEAAEDFHLPLCSACHRNRWNVLPNSWVLAVTGRTIS